MLIYINNCYEDYPTPDKWCDLLMRYANATEKQFKCPGNNKAKCSYAINPNANIHTPPDMVLIFETKGGWNQFGGPELITTRNHEGEGCNVLFNDFHVEFVKPAQIGQLKWKVE